MITVLGLKQLAVWLKGGHAWLEERAQSIVVLPECSRYSVDYVLPLAN